MQLPYQSPLGPPPMAPFALHDSASAATPPPPLINCPSHPVPMPLSADWNTLPQELKDAMSKADYLLQTSVLNEKTLVRQSDPP